MFKGSEAFEKNYNHYRDQIAGVDLASIQRTLGADDEDGRLRIRLFGRDYRVSKEGIVDSSGNRPDYRVCVLLAKYVLLCPDQPHHDPAWVSFKDFKRASHFTNVNFFASDTQQVLVKAFDGRLDALASAGKKLGGLPDDGNNPYDLVMQFAALPRLSLLLLFNDSDDEFPAQCNVLFQKQAEFYLAPESLAITSALLAKYLVENG